jgi:hypothetical protein
VCLCRLAPPCREAATGDSAGKLPRASVALRRPRFIGKGLKLMEIPLMLYNLNNA